MGNSKTADSRSALSLLPSTDELLQTATAVRLAEKTGHRRLTMMSRAVIAELRGGMIDGRIGGGSKDELLAEAARGLDDLWKSRLRSRLRRVINATGVIVHTNLGRAPLSSDAVKAIGEASGYTTLEFDIATGRRGTRGGNVEAMLAEITGAEAALVVNNCAAAALLVLSVFAKGGDAIVSRGELVEIGGDFRVPDVMVQSGASLVEVGTTNRTKLADYEKAIGANTRVVMRVHPSNYRIVGFTEKPSLADLAGLCRSQGVMLYEDAGSGAMIDLSTFDLSDEPEIAGSIAAGADVVTFSGDKLLGGPQAGLIVGRREQIKQIRRHPLYRALRVDKLAYAALGATLESYLSESAQASVPVLRMLSLTKEQLADRVGAIAKQIATEIPSSVIEVVDGESVVGGGSAPTVRLETKLITLWHPEVSAEAIEERLREADLPVIARIDNDRVVIDLRTVEPSDDAELLAGLATALRSH